MEKWVIYCHKNLTNGKVYIGQTKQGLNQRWRSGNGYKTCPIFFRAIQKYGWDGFSHFILEDNIFSKEEADDKERFWISAYNSTDKNCGYNICDGGQGMTSEQSLSYIKKNWQDPVFRAKFEIPVICTNNGKVYNSLTEASRQTGIDKTAIIRNCKKRTKSSGIDELGRPCVWEYFQPDKEYSYQDPREEWQNSQKVICISTGDVFPSASEAARQYAEYGTKQPSITSCCTGRNHSAGEIPGKGGLIWSYWEPNKEYVIGKFFKRGKAVICITTNQTFDSAKQASQKIGVAASGITNCCRGKQKKAGNLPDGTPLKWMYLEEFENNEDDK